MPKSHVNYLFSGIDADDSGRIDLKEFMKICFALQESYVRVRTMSYVERNYTKFWNAWELNRVKQWAEDEESYIGLPSLAQIVLSINAVFVILESHQDLSHNSVEHEDMILPQFAWGVINLAFSLVYSAELATKITTIPFDKYWLYSGNRFDFVVTIALLIISVLWAIPQVHIDSETLRFFSIIRLLRLLELPARIKRYSFIVDCVVFMAKGCTSVIAVVFVATSLWCIVGVQV